MIPTVHMLDIDRYALIELAQLSTEAEACYTRYEFHPVVAALQRYCSEQLGGFYLDILKDRLYTSAENSPARRSAQTALYQITHTLLRLMAPILSFTAEEAWQHFASPEDYIASGETLFTGTYHPVPAVADAALLAERFARLRDIRSSVMKQLEASRTSGAIGSSLQAELTIHAGGADFAALAALDDELKFVLIVSSVRLIETRDAAAGAPVIEVAASTAPKCERCWHYRPDVGEDARHPGLCARCVGNLFGRGECRTHA